MGRYYALNDGEDPRGGRGDRRALPAARPGRRGARPRRSRWPWRWPTSWISLVGFFAVGRKADRLQGPLRAAPRGARRHPPDPRERRCGLPTDRERASLPRRRPPRPAAREQRLMPGRRRWCSRRSAGLPRRPPQVQLRDQGVRHDLVAAVFGAAPEDDLVRLLARVRGARSIPGERRTAPTCWRPTGGPPTSCGSRTSKDGPHDGAGRPRPARTGREDERWSRRWPAPPPKVAAALAARRFPRRHGSAGRPARPGRCLLRQGGRERCGPATPANRLRLLNRLCAAMDAVADFSKIEG